MRTIITILIVICIKNVFSQTCAGCEASYLTQPTYTDEQILGKLKENEFAVIFLFEKTISPDEKSFKKKNKDNSKLLEHFNAKVKVFKWDESSPNIIQLDGKSKRISGDDYEIAERLWLFYKNTISYNTSKDHKVFRAGRKKYYELFWKDLKIPEGAKVYFQRRGEKEIFDIFNIKFYRKSIVDRQENHLGSIVDIRELKELFFKDQVVIAPISSPYTHSGGKLYLGGNEVTKWSEIYQVNHYQREGILYFSCCVSNIRFCKDEALCTSLGGKPYQYILSNLDDVEDVMMPKFALELFKEVHLSKEPFYETFNKVRYSSIKSHITYSKENYTSVRVAIEQP